jgi:thioredoxin reductase
VSDVIVAGAGRAGLASAVTLAGRGHQVLVVDRLPVPGGERGYEGSLISSLFRRADRLGVTFRLGSTAVRLDEQGLLAAGPTAIDRLPCSQLVVATGWRPRTLAELGIAGDRLAGVVASTVASHLIDARVNLGRRIMVVGAGRLGLPVMRRLDLRHHEVTVIHLDGDGEALNRHARAIRGWTPVSVRGDGRVSRLILRRGCHERPVGCDAVVLAGRPVPLRNIDGAISPSDGVRHVTITGALEAGPDEVIAAVTRELDHEPKGTGSHEGQFTGGRVPLPPGEAQVGLR